MRIFLDTSVVFDVLAERAPWFGDSAAVLSLVELEDVEGFIAAHTVTTLYFVLAKHVGSRKARNALLQLLDVVSVAAVDEATLKNALSLGLDDFEDAVQSACAMAVAADFLITRDTPDFEALSIPVHTPSAFLALIRGVVTEAGVAAPGKVARKRKPGRGLS